MNTLHSVCLFVLLISVLTEANEIEKNELSSAANWEEQQCSSYTFKVVNPLLEHLHKIQKKLDNNDIVVKSKDAQIKELQSKVTELQQKLSDIVQAKLDDSYTAQMGFLRETVQQMSQSCQLPKNETDQEYELKRTVAAQSEMIRKQNDQIMKFLEQNDLNAIKMRECENNFEIKTNLIRQKDELISNLQTQQQNIAGSLNETRVKFQDCESNLVDSCAPFANSPGIHNIEVPGLAPFDVLCESAGTEGGWIVIQQRINGQEDFYRDWATYRDGFGSFNGDFFLGLEKIYRLTSNKRHKLYIHLERFNGDISYAAYDDFAISGEDEQYKLIRVEGYSGNTGTPDYLGGYHKGQRFHTFDRDTVRECAKERHGGWWYHSCAISHLNGKYFDHEVRDDTSNYWYGHYSLKRVQMFIRPN